MKSSFHPLVDHILCKVCHRFQKGMGFCGRLMGMGFCGRLMGMGFCGRLMAEDFGICYLSETDHALSLDHDL